MRPVLLTTFVVLLLVGCATGGPPISYQQASPAYRPVRPPPVFTPGYSPETPPEPVYTPAGAGLPGERVPGASGASVPRSPNKRLLPRTDEPGLWAADKARAMDPREKPPDTPGLLGFVLPFPLAAETDRERELTRWCAYKMGNAIKETDRAGDVWRLPSDTRRCIAARLYEHCANIAWGVYEAAERAGELYSPPDLERIKAAQETARAFKKSACKEPLSPDADRIHDAAAELYDLEVFSP